MDYWKNLFPDWDELEPGDWSAHGTIIQYDSDGKGMELEIGLYREPLDSGEYAGTYTLQIFDGDDVVFCRKVDA